MPKKMKKKSNKGKDLAPANPSTSHGDDGEGDSDGMVLPCDMFAPLG